MFTIRVGEYSYLFGSWESCYTFMTTYPNEFSRDIVIGLVDPKRLEYDIDF